MKALLALEDGLVLEGKSFGARGEKTGEVVFNTSMTGYQEVLTDPSYKGQIVAMTYPHIGNYGVNPEDFESRAPCVEGFAVREYSGFPSNWRATAPLGEFLQAYGIVGIEQIDTRCLTKRLRTAGSMKGILTTERISAKAAVQRARQAPDIVGRDLVQLVTCSETYEWQEPFYDINAKGDEFTPQKSLPLGVGEEGASDTFRLVPASRSTFPFRVVAMDFGIKHNILRRLQSYGVSTLVVPASWSAEEILEQKPDGILLSNGPGDPEPVAYAIKTVSHLIGKRPILGICLGHQITALAMGGKTYKLKFGHHGGNQPVQDLRTGKVQITAQNHNFAVDLESVEDKGMLLTHKNLNDETVEGLEHKELPLFSVQYHPEASPGPHDADYLFGKFVEQMAAWKRSHA